MPGIGPTGGQLRFFRRTRIQRSLDSDFLTIQRRGADVPKNQYGARILHGLVGFPLSLGELAHIQIWKRQAEWLCFLPNHCHAEPAMTTLMSATRALNRQKIAVERTRIQRSLDSDFLTIQGAGGGHQSSHGGLGVAMVG